MWPRTVEKSCAHPSTFVYKADRRINYLQSIEHSEHSIIPSFLLLLMSGESWKNFFNCLLLVYFTYVWLFFQTIYIHCEVDKRDRLIDIYITIWLNGILGCLAGGSYGAQSGRLNTSWWCCNQQMPNVNQKESVWWKSDSECDQGFVFIAAARKTGVGHK